MNKKQWLGLGLVAVAAVGLAACGNRSSRNAASSSDVKTKAAIVTDTGGVDDKSFNNQLGKVCKTGVKNTILQKIKVSLTSNQQVKLTTLTTCNKRLEVTTKSSVLVLPLIMQLKDAAKDHSDLNYVLI